MLTNEIVKLTRRGIVEVLEQRHGADATCVGKERRRAPRWPFPGTVEIHPLGGDGSEHWFGTCRNLSDTGLGMSAEQYFEPETVLDIALHLPEASFCGKAVVRYCMRTPQGFMTGLEFDFAA